MQKLLNKPTDYRLTCASCGQQWVRRGDTLPKQCPRCGDRHWNKVKK